MKLNKHKHVFVNIIIKIISRSSTKKFGRGELCSAINSELNDKRIYINTKQLPTILKQQDKFVFEKNRQTYNFKEHENK